MMMILLFIVLIKLWSNQPVVLRWQRRAGAVLLSGIFCVAGSRARAARCQRVQQPANAAAVPEH